MQVSYVVIKFSKELIYSVNNRLEYLKCIYSLSVDTTFTVYLVIYIFLDLANIIVYDDS